jgi:hypothetical protein
MKLVLLAVKKQEDVVLKHVGAGKKRTVAIKEKSLTIIEVGMMQMMMKGTIQEIKDARAGAVMTKTIQ